MNYKNFKAAAAFLGMFTYTLSASNCGDNEGDKNKKNKRESVDKFYQLMVEGGLMRTKVDSDKNVTYEWIPEATQAIERVIAETKLLNDNKEQLKSGKTTKVDFGYKEGEKKGIVPKSLVLAEA